MTALPPFSLPSAGVKVNSGLWYPVRQPAQSDGEQRHWPGIPDYRPFPDTIYRIKLATEWKIKRGQAQPSQSILLCLVTKRN